MLCERRRAQANNGVGHSAEPDPSSELLLDWWICGRLRELKDREITAWHGQVWVSSDEKSDQE
jgi:hypothetical protein